MARQGETACIAGQESGGQESPLEDASRSTRLADGKPAVFGLPPSSRMSSPSPSHRAVHLGAVRHRQRHRADPKRTAERERLLVAPPPAPVARPPQGGAPARTGAPSSRNSHRNSVIIAALPAGEMVDSSRVSLRDWAEGCTTEPVGYIEGWYVQPIYRRSGVGRQLIEAAEHWATSWGCTRRWDPTWNSRNEVSQMARHTLGYSEATARGWYVTPRSLRNERPMSRNSVGPTRLGARSRELCSACQAGAM